MQIAPYSVFCLQRELVQGTHRLVLVTPFVKTPAFTGTGLKR
jgi:hypothetical protein